MANQQLSLKFMIIMSEAMRKSRRAKYIKSFWKALSRFQPVNAVYIKNYKRFIDFTELSKNPHIDDEIIDMYFDKLDIGSLLKCHDLSKEILTKHAKEFKNYIESTKTVTE